MKIMKLISKIPMTIKVLMPLKLKKRLKQEKPKPRSKQ